MRIISAVVYIDAARPSMGPTATNSPRWTRCANSCRTCSVREILGRLQQELYFRRAQNHRQFPLVPRQRDAIDTDGTVQGVGVKKSESANGLYIRRKGDTFLFDQVQLIFADLLRAEQFGRFAKVFGKLGDVANVGGYSGGCIVANLEIFQHSHS